MNQVSERGKQASVYAQSTPGYLKLCLGSNEHSVKKKKKKKKEKNVDLGSVHGGTAVTNLTSIHEVAGLIPAVTQWVKDLALL